MSRWARSFDILPSRAARVMHELYKITGTFNGAKIGKHRRGTALLASVSGYADAARVLWRIEVTFWDGVPLYLRCPGHSPKQLYSIESWRRAFRLLARGRA